MWKRGGKWYKYSHYTTQFKQKIIERGEFSTVIWKHFYSERTLISKKTNRAKKKSHFPWIYIAYFISYCWHGCRVLLSECVHSSWRVEMTLGKQQVSVLDLELHVAFQNSSRSCSLQPLATIIPWDSPYAFCKHKALAKHNLWQPMWVLSVVIQHSKSISSFWLCDQSVLSW